MSAISKYLSWRTVVLAVAIIIPVLAITFMAGAFAHKRCMFPFCQGYLVEAREAVREATGTDPAPVENQARLLGTDTLRTTLYEVDIRKYQQERYPPESDIPKEYIKGRDGGIDNMGEELLIASGEGTLFHLDTEFNIQHLLTSVPLNRRAFAQDTRQFSGFSNEWFGVKDILVEEVGSNTFRLLASHHHWNAEESCHTLRVSQTVLEASQDSVKGQGGWKTIFETSPCLAVTNELKHPFSGHEAGGRIVRLSDEEILLSVGYQGHDGVHGQKLSQETTNSYGKIIRINTSSGNSSIYSYGHRNPQGLHIDAEGRIWSTEHGPRGGDELNLIQEGLNYGWPLVTYGVDYGTYEWPLSERQGSHEKFERPIYAWVPSIGISELISIQKDLFELWQGDLLVSSLKGGKLFRVRVRDGRVIFAEPVPIGLRIRDLVETESGMIVLKTDTGTLVTLHPGKTSVMRDDPS